jgi:hypothetical protein
MAVNTKRQLAKSRATDKFHPAGVVQTVVKNVRDTEFFYLGQKNPAVEEPLSVLLKSNCLYTADHSTLSAWVIET